MGTLINSTLSFSPATAQAEHRFISEARGDGAGWCWGLWAPQKASVEQVGKKSPSGKAQIAHNTPFNWYKHRVSVLNNTEYRCRTQRCACAAIALPHLLIWGILDHN